MIPYPKYPKSNAIIHILSLDGQQCQIISESERVLHTSVTFDKLNRQINQMSFKPVSMYTAFHLEINSERERYTPAKEMNIESNPFFLIKRR